MTSRAAWQDVGQQQPCECLDFEHVFPMCKSSNQTQTQSSDMPCWRHACTHKATAGIKKGLYRNTGSRLEWLNQQNDACFCQTRKPWTRCLSCREDCTEVLLAALAAAVDFALHSVMYTLNYCIRVDLSAVPNRHTTHMRRESTKSQTNAA